MAKTSRIFPKFHRTSPPEPLPDAASTSETLAPPQASAYSFESRYVPAGTCHLYFRSSCFYHTEKELHTVCFILMLASSYHI